MQGKTIYTVSGETVKVQNQWAAETERRSATVSSSEWEFTGSGTLSSAALSTPLASTFLAPTGDGVLSNTVTLSNGEVLISRRSVLVY